MISACGMTIESRFRAYLPKERIKGLWETDAGLAFIQRQRVASGLWESPGPEPTGLYHVVIHLEACRLSATHNGRVHYSGYHPARTIQFSRPEEEVRCTGYGSINLASDLRLAELSALAGISRSHFARAFRNTVGMAPHAFVLQRRLARACELLTQRKLPIREVAERCGFADQAHLTRAFKSRFDRRPPLQGPRMPARTCHIGRRSALGDGGNGDRPLKAGNVSQTGMARHKVAALLRGKRDQARTL